MKRLFIALTLSESLKKEILAWQKQNIKMPVRWIKDKNLHVTIVPPWYSDDTETVIERMKTVARNYHPIKIFMNKISFGPNPKEPRLIWTEGDTPKELPQLKSELEKALGQKSDPRPFRLHITLAHFSPYDFEKMPDKQLNENIIWNDELSALVLMESLLSPSGADYKVLREIKL